MSQKEITKSAKLRRYKKVYAKYMRVTTKSPSSPRPRRIRRIRKRGEKGRIKTTINIPPQTKPKKRKKNAYQKFITKESKKSKYDGIPGSERLELMAIEWNNYKRKKRKEEKKKKERGKKEKRLKKNS